MTQWGSEVGEERVGAAEASLFTDAGQEQELSLDLRAQLLNRYQQVRAETEALADPLSAEDMQLQSMPDASPTKWHLGHTSWFFETFVLRPHLNDYRRFDPDFHHLFNSYYNSLGQPFTRPLRGMLSRPDIDQVFAYRQHVDLAVERLLSEEDCPSGVGELLTLGTHHEQQHQELLLTDILHAFSHNPLLPAYIDEDTQGTEDTAGELSWLQVPEDLYPVGSEGEHFHFDNEGPAHQQHLPAFRIASRLVNNREFLEFIEDGGYRDPRLWLSDGWAWLQQGNRQAPLYWQQREGQWLQFGLTGLQALNPDAPVSHISYYEADAFATWAGARLPTEFEWEVAAWLNRQPAPLSTANLLEQRRFSARPETGQPTQFLGNLWQWTGSAYLPYPGFRPSADAVGEYNGKFMCNQMVLRGGSCVTPTSHIRISYRNFFYPHQAWQFTGIRLAGETD